MAMKNKNAYDIYVFHRSYFCGKMLAYLRYKGIPFNPVYGSLAEYGDEIANNTGLRQMPVIKTPDNIWLQDTTPMIDWFEARYPKHALLPKDPVVAFLTRLLEDYADEWMWRPAIYYRWMHAEDRKLYKTMFVKEFLGGAWGWGGPFTWLAGKLVHKHQRDKFLYGDGMTEQNREHVESIYINTLDRLEVIFQQQPYLLGDKPCLADFGFFGSMFWHFGNDPTSNRIMQERAPAVYEWTARLWNMRPEKADGMEFNTNGDVPLGWEPLLKDMCENYLPYLELNAINFDKGQKKFDLSSEGYLYPNVNTSPYRVYCRERLQSFLNTMSLDDQRKVQRILQPLGGWEPLTSHSYIKSMWDPEGIAPLCHPKPISSWEKFKAHFTGSNHIQTLRAWNR